MSDVKLFHTNDNGDINVSNGVVELSAGLGSAAYLSLFGGNEDDPGGSDRANSWWGNSIEPEKSRRLRSETQNILASIPAIPRNLRRVEQAVLRDLQWMLDESVANTVEASATIPGLNRVTIAVTITARGEESRFEFTENWKASP